MEKNNSCRYRSAKLINAQYDQITKARVIDLKLTNEHIEIAQKNGVSYNTLYRRIKDYGWDIEEAINTPILKKGQMRKERKLNQYALYKGDDFLFQGTAKECAEFLGVKRHTVYWMTTPSYHKRVKDGNRLIAIKIDDIEDDWVDEDDW